ncbi:MAG: hypothetical protein NVS2B14_17690 [Chamaesiphon sp.]
MPPILKVGNRIINEAEIIPLLAGYRLLPQLWRELMISEAIALVECTISETTLARQQFYEQHQLTGEAEISSWLAYYGMRREQLEALAIRELKIEKFKQATWGHRLEAYFLNQKSQLDQVIYSLLRTSDAEVAQELYFRLSAGEQSFASLAGAYSQGPESQTGGLLGPVALCQLHPELAQKLSKSQPGQLWPPIRLDNWIAIIRLEKFIPAQLDEPMRQHLLDRLFENWLSEAIANRHSTTSTELAENRV